MGTWLLAVIHHSFPQAKNLGKEGSSIDEKDPACLKIPWLRGNAAILPSECQHMSSFVPWGAASRDGWNEL